MQIIFLQLVVNLVFTKFYKEPDWKWFKYLSVIVFPVMTAFATYFRKIKYTFNSQSDSTLLVEKSPILFALFLAFISLGLQLLLNDRFEKRKKKTTS